MMDKIKEICEHVNAAMDEIQDGLVGKIKYRQGFIERFLKNALIPYRVVQNKYLSHGRGFERFHGEGNVLVSLEGRNDDRHVLLVAHHDCVPVSNGIFDNYCAVACLLCFLKEIRQNGALNCNLDILFTSVEECGMVGARNFVNSPYMKNYSNIIVFDSCGVGDRFFSDGSPDDVILKCLMDEIGGVFSPSLPLCEGSVFRNACKHDQVGVLCSGFLDERMKCEKYPGFYHYPMNILNYMHGYNKDDISYVNFEMLGKLRKALLKVFAA